MVSNVSISALLSTVTVNRVEIFQLKYKEKCFLDFFLSSILNQQINLNRLDFFLRGISNSQKTNFDITTKRTGKKRSYIFAASWHLLRLTGTNKLYSLFVSSSSSLAWYYLVNARSYVWVFKLA